MRGTGRTTKQMKAAPKGALFIWCTPALFYPKRLARELDREDLEIVRPSYILSDKWRGRTFPYVVVDHAFWYLISRDDRYKMADMLDDLCKYCIR